MQYQTVTCDIICPYAPCVSLCYVIGSGVDVCIRDFNRRSIRIRETRRVKVGHIATGISDQVRASSLTLVCQGSYSCLSVSLFVKSKITLCLMLTCVSFLDLWEGFHLGDPAGPAGCSRWGGAGVRSGALLCSCSRLQLCLEVEDQRRSAGDEIEPTALSFNRPQCHLHRCTRGLLFNCLNVWGPCLHQNINLPEPPF